MNTPTATKQRKGAFPIWVVIAVGGVLTSVSLGIRSTFGVFLDPVVEGVLDGVQGPWGIAIAVQSIMWGISQPIAGAISDRYGGAVTFAGGTILYAIALLLMSTAQSAFMIILAGGFLTGIAVGAASFAVVLSAVGRMVSPARRSMALGIVSAAGSMGQFVLVPLARIMIDRWSWQDTFVVFAVIAAATILLTPSLRGSARRFFPEPAATANDRTLRDELRRAARARPYLLLNAAFFVCGFHVTFIGAYLPKYGEDLGHKGTATTALALIGLFNVFGSLAAGALGGRYSKTKLLGGIYAARAVVIAAYVLLRHHPLRCVVRHRVLLPPTWRICRRPRRQLGPRSLRQLRPGVVDRSCTRRRCPAHSPLDRRRSDPGPSDSSGSWRRPTSCWRHGQCHAGRGHRCSTAAGVVGPRRVRWRAQLVFLGDRAITPQRRDAQPPQQDSLMSARE